jgi:hypothetical protein
MRPSERARLGRRNGLPASAFDSFSGKSDTCCDCSVVIENLGRSHVAALEDGRAPLVGRIAVAPHG